MLSNLSSAIVNEWQNIQNLNEFEYIKYYNENIAAKKEFRFMQVNKKGDVIFLWQHRKMILDHITSEITLGITALCQVYNAVGLSKRPLMISQDKFIQNCKLWPIAEENLNYFFSHEMDMRDEDWENY
jgi:hypothetical protein